MKYSLVIPARNEAEGIAATVQSLTDALDAEQIDYEVIVVDDASVDDTAAVVDRIAQENSRVRSHRSHNPPGFGFAVRAGLDIFTGDAVAIVMADGSDSASDVVAYYRALEAGHECVFGSRFVRGARVVDYPRTKLILNRIVNAGIRLLFHHGYNDTTNAFKAYRREVIETAQPLLSNQFNLTVELPLKAVARGHRFTVIPISWTNRATGRSKLKLQEMGSRYVFIVLYVWLERLLSRGDYRRRQP
ncbi:MAG TPA: glycosyltransferase family 2 protein [Gaiellaceae bacterium]|jgi:dolichol-phosphate mannosyltransferase